MALIASGKDKIEIVVHMTLHALEGQVLAGKRKLPLIVVEIISETLLHRIMAQIALCRKTARYVIRVLRS
jgi:hypothetical protein